MTIRFAKSYTKQYDKLAPKIQSQADQQVKLFASIPFSQQLHNHALTGKHIGYCSINIIGDVRALYYEKDEQIVIFAFIGTHSQLYGK